MQARTGTYLCALVCWAQAPHEDEFKRKTKEELMHMYVYTRIYIYCIYLSYMNVYTCV